MTERTLELNNIYNMDCLEGMAIIPNGVVDMILCNLPCGTTQNKWNSVIPLEPLWEQYRRIIKPNGAIVLTGQGLFTAKIITSNARLYRYSLEWEKTKAGGLMNAKRMPLQAHEDIMMFYNTLPTYNPQMEVGEPYIKKAVTDGDGGNYGKVKRVGDVNVNDGTRYPRSVLTFSNDNHNSIHSHSKARRSFRVLNSDLYESRQTGARQLHWVPAQLQSPP